MADLEKHERADDRPPSAFRRAVPVAPFPEYEPGPPPGMDRATVLVLLVMGSAVLLGAWLGLTGPGGADSGGVAAAPSPTGRPGALAADRAPAPGDAGTRGHEADRGVPGGATGPRTGSGASAPRAVEGAGPQPLGRHPAGRARTSRSEHAAGRREGRSPGVPGPAEGRAPGVPGPAEGRAPDTAGRREGAGARRQEARTRHLAGPRGHVRTGGGPGTGDRTPRPPGQGTGDMTPRHPEPGTSHMTPNRPRPKTGDMTPNRPRPGTGDMTSNRPRPGTGRETSSRDTSPRRSPVAGDRRPASPGQRSGGTAGAAGAGEGRPAPRASSRGPRPGLLHQWCEDNFTTAPLLARACHLYVTP